MLRLVLPDGRHVPLTGEVTIGRASDNTVRLADRTVSRRHARISSDAAGTTIEDAGSTFGTWVDGHQLAAPEELHDGTLIRVGISQLRVERPDDEPEKEGRTVMVLEGASQLMPAVRGGPQLRSGYALKRLEAAEGERRWVLKSLRSERFVRLAEPEAELLELLDGRPASELVVEAERRLGPSGPGRLARLLAELADRDMLTGTEESEQPRAPAGLLQRLIGPREYVWHGADAAIERLHRGPAGRLVQEPAVTVLAMLAASGIGVFAYLVAGRYGTPFVVARKVGLGALVFLVGRLAIAAVHEAAHGLVIASFGRHVHRAGLKLVAIFPFAFVDTSDAWFEPRRRRIAISAAGPVADFTLGAVFALSCLALRPGSVRDVFFQLAFAAYVGAIFNLNPFTERDGYHILVDLLREPGLRGRAREALRRRLSGSGGASDDRVLTRYSIFGLVWMVAAVGFAIAMSLRFEPVLASLVPAPAAHVLLALVWTLVATPLMAIVGKPLLDRVRERDVANGAA
jgi:putative peptide zinc metalloprotease protein